MSENVGASTGKHPALARKKAEAARLVAEDELTEDVIAETVGISVRQLYRWRYQDEAFRARVSLVRSRIAERIMNTGIARKENRVKAMDDRWHRFQQIADEWAERGLEDRHGQPVPGSRTGYMRQQAKSTAAGIVYEYAADTGLSAELRALEKQAAQEAGQWTEKTDLTSAGQPIESNVLIYLPQKEPPPEPGPPPE